MSGFKDKAIDVIVEEEEIETKVTPVTETPKTEYYLTMLTAESEILVQLNQTAQLICTGMTNRNDIRISWHLSETNEVDILYTVLSS